MQNQLTTEELYTTRSEEIQEILGKPPTFLMRWGIPALLLVFIGSLLLAHFVRYPDTVVAPALLTTNPPPVRLMSKASGYLRLLVADGAEVSAGKPLAYIQNPADLEAVLALEKRLLQSPLPTFKNNPFREVASGNLGELQTYYDALLSAYSELQIRYTYPTQQYAQSTLSQQLQREKGKAQNLYQQDTLNREAFAQSYKNYQIDSLLFAQRVKTPVEFYQAKGDFTRQKQTLKNSEATLLGQTAQMATIQERIQEVRLQAGEQEAKLLLVVENSYRNLTTQLAMWKHRYVLLSPVAGKVHFLQYWADNQYIGAEQEVMAITPTVQTSTHIVKLKIPTQGAGKVQTGQKVWVSLADYPTQEFGKLQGNIIRITPILQTEKGKEEGGKYMAIVQLASLRTDYGKTLAVKPEMQGEAHILTLEYTLLERMLAPLRKVTSSL